MLTLALLAALTQTPAPPPDDEPGLTGTISLIGGATLSSSGFIPGLGFAGELGVRLIDGWALTATAELFGIIILMNAQAGVHAMRMLSPRVGLGFGVRLSQTVILASHIGGPNTAILVPLRLSYLLTEPVEQRRSGFVFTLDVAPGVQVGGTFYGAQAPLALSATVGIGWTAW